MLKKYAVDMDFEDFKDALSSELLNELTKMNISYQKAYEIFQNMLTESKHGEEDDIGTMESIVRNIILDFTDDLCP